MGVSRRPIDKQKPQRMGHCGFFITHNPQGGVNDNGLEFYHTVPDARVHRR